MGCHRSDVHCFLASPEDTIVAKRRDVAGILSTMGEELDRPCIERWVDELELTQEWHLNARPAASKCTARWRRGAP